MGWIEWRGPLLAALVAGIVPRQANAQDWSRFDEAANVVAQAHHELTLERRERRRAWGRWMEIASTGSRTLDSLSRHFGAARVLIDVDSATGSPKSLGTIAIEYLRPMNVARIEAAYQAAGFSTYAPFRTIVPRDYSSVVWTSLPHSDLFHFRLEAGCNDLCRRHERYLVRVPRGPGPAEMLEREVRIDPDR